jgi:hypothetical protein
MTWTGDHDPEVSAVEETARLFGVPHPREVAHQRPKPAPPPPRPRPALPARIWAFVRSLILLLVAGAAILLGLAVLGSIAGDRGPKCDTPSACDTYEPPDDVGVP